MYPDGSTHPGNFVLGKREGQGIVTYPDGRHFVGIWEGDEEIEGRYVRGAKR
jgi:hypothetical protein